MSEPAKSGLLAEAAALDVDLAGAAAPAAAAAPGVEAPTPALPLDQEIAGIFAAIGAGVGSFFPSVKAVLSEPKCDELGKAIAPVLEKYGLQHYVAGFAWRVELRAALVVVPTAIALKAAIAQDIAAAKAAAAAPKGGPPLGADAAGDAGGKKPDDDKPKPAMLHPV